ncbi:hypothetical protein ABZ234_08155 [Nocardiopsis sp. NPDC006198]|uniref:hypothetical protein n=1 Tax=Nocardiopsis sp. NPDC006198 TaxID=3154472 RepID=UPI0033AF03FE
MTETEGLGVAQVRDQLAKIVADAERGRITYIRPRYAPAPVAAVVPAALAREGGQEPAQPLPSAPGGAFAPGPGGEASTEERAWTGAALAGAHHHLTRVITEAANALAAVGAAQAAHAGGDTEGARHQLAAAEVERTLVRLGGAEIEALDLYYALTDRGPLECEACGHGLTRPSGDGGWLHVEPDGSGGYRARLDVDHEPVPRHRPPARPDIADGSVVRAS